MCIGSPRTCPSCPATLAWEAPAVTPPTTPGLTPPSTQPAVWPAKVPALPSGCCELLGWKQEGEQRLAGFSTPLCLFPDQPSYRLVSRSRPHPSMVRRSLGTLESVQAPPLLRISFMAPTSFRLKAKVLAVAHKGSGSDLDTSLPFPPPTVSHNHTTPAAYHLHVALSFRVQLSFRAFVCAVSLRTSGCCHIPLVQMRKLRPRGAE